MQHSRTYSGTSRLVVDMSDAVKTVSFKGSSFCFTAVARSPTAEVQLQARPPRVAEGDFKVVRHLYAVRLRKR